MRSINMMLLCSVFFLGCSHKENSDNPASPSQPQMEKKQTIDGADWLVVGKTCNAQNQDILGQERLHFDNGLFAHIFQTQDDQNKICNQAQVFSRIIQSFSSSQSTSNSESSNANYSERSNLLVQQQKTVCRDKSTGKIIEDQTSSFVSPPQTLAMSFVGDNATADMNNSPFCTSGILHFDLQRK